MARSRHATRRALLEEARWDVRDRAARKIRLQKLREELQEKRRIKRQVLGERRAEGTPVAGPVDVDSIPIRVEDAGPYVHYPASPEDLREVLRRLPVGVGDGLEAIDLVLGSEVQDAHAREKGLDREVDPFVGSPGMEVLPGVHCGYVLGTYYSPQGLIRLYPYVYDSAIHNLALKETYLRLHFLSTFVHELAHHEDWMLRRGRGRWRFDSHEKTETYAESTQQEWVVEAVIPFLRERHGEGLAELESWTEKHVRVRFPLEWLCGDPETTETAGLAQVFGGISGCFEDLVENVESGEAPRTVRLQFATRLHFNGHYDLALDIVETLIAEHPADLECLTAKADFLNHLERNAEASEILLRVLAANPDLEKAWSVRALVALDGKDWVGVLEATANVLRLSEKRFSHVVARQARALLELERFGELGERIAELKAGGSPLRKAEAFAFEAMALLRTAKLEEALAVAAEGLAIVGSRTWRDKALPELVAVRFDALCRLGRGHEAPPLEEETLDALVRRGHEEWASRLRQSLSRRSQPLSPE